MAGLAFLFNQDDVRSLSGPDEVTLGSGLSQGGLDLRNEAVMEISPQPTGLDIGIHAWKWRFHEAPPRWNLIPTSNIFMVSRPLPEAWPAR